VKRTLAAILAVVAALFAANMLGVAVAEAPTVTTLRTVSVEGVATLPIGQFANGGEATAVYREGQANAINDAQAKAGFLAAKVGGSQGPAQSVVEGGGYIGCRGGDEEEGSYAEYGGVEPDFGRASAPNVVNNTTAVAPAKGVALGQRVKPKRRKHKRPKAKKAATAVSCTLTAQVSLVYTLN
jgi:hypothetical protein